MWAYRLTQWESDPEVVDIAVPDPGPGEVRVRVGGVGLCHSDLTMSAMPGSVGEALGWSMPFTLGHETAGWVDLLGDGVSSVRVGEAVAVLSPHPCGQCRDCAAGRDILCAKAAAGRGYGRDGGLAEFVTAPAWHLVALGELDPTLVAPLTDAGATSHHAVARVAHRLVDGATVAVLGAGGLGGFAVQLCAALGDAAIAVVDPIAQRRDEALRLGAHHAIDGVDRGTAAALREWGSGGVDVVLDFVGTDDTIRSGLRALRPGGAFGLVGAGGGGFAKPWFGGLPSDAELFTFQGSSLADLRAVVDLAQRGSVTVGIEQFSADRVADAYRSLEDGTVRGRAVVLPPSGFN